MVSNLKYKSEEKWKTKMKYHLKKKKANLKKNQEDNGKFYRLQKKKKLLLKIHILLFTTIY